MIIICVFILLLYYYNKKKDKLEVTQKIQFSRVCANTNDNKNNIKCIQIKLIKKINLLLHIIFLKASKDCLCCVYAGLTVIKEYFFKL